ncbi:MAG TPA: hypothetical protein VN577_11445 [Terriglobales bacterium]|nr:hypothetical protein [Terriglobales bacterium]
MLSPNTIVVAPGTVLIHASVMLLASLKIETSLYSKSWRLITTDQETLSGSIAAAGWNFFFTVLKLEGLAFGTLAPKTLDRALRRILRQVQDMHFNAVEIVKVETHKALGLVPYIGISAHARHIQRSEQLENDEQRKTAQAQSAWAIG